MLKFNLLSIITSLALPLVALAQAQPQSIQIHGVDVPVKKIGYYADTNIIHSFEVTKAVTIPFARGNTFSVTTGGFLDRQGNLISVISMTPQEVSWLMPNGKKSRLDCGNKFNQYAQPMARMVGFHPNREYRSGCNSYDGIEFVDAWGGKVTAFSDFDVSPDFKLTYAKKIGSGVLKIGQGQVTLLPGSDIAYHENGVPRFFTLVHGEKFEVEQPGYGKLVVTQKEGKHSVTQLFKDGTLERGISAQDLRHRELDILIPAGSGVWFSPLSVFGLVITDTILVTPQPFPVKGYTLMAGRVQWDLEKGFITLQLTEPFVFTNPQTKETVGIPAGSVIGLNKNREIIGIKVPAGSQGI